jgi:hypothetical protein
MVAALMETTDMTLNDLMNVDLNPLAYLPPEVTLPSFDVVLGFAAFLMAAPYLAFIPFALVAILWAIIAGNGPVWSRVTMAVFFLFASVAVLAGGL